MPRAVSSSILIAAWAAAAQPAFDVASIRPTRLVSGVEGGNRPKVVVAPGELMMHRHTLRDAIEWAYGVRSFQIAGPAAINDERYEIGARVDAPATPAQLRLMLRTLLADRFRLSLHRERKDVAVYGLVLGRNGPKLHASAGEESGWSKLPGPGLRLSFRASTVAQLAEFLSTLVFVDRPVIDATGLGSDYDFALDLREVADSADAARPSLGTLLEEQLGLKLDARKAPFEMLVIDRAERPAAN
jgi:uncharacterized protein (TIGR03435 family)